MADLGRMVCEHPWWLIWADWPANFSGGQIGQIGPEAPPGGSFGRWVCECPLVADLGSLVSEILPIYHFAINIISFMVYILTSRGYLLC